MKQYLVFAITTNSLKDYILPQWGEWEATMLNGGVTLTKVIEPKLISNIDKMAKMQCTISAVTMMAINQVENLIDRVWTEENGRPPNTHKKVFIEEQWSFQWCVNVNQDCQLKIMQVVVHQMKFAGESWQDKVSDIKVKAKMIGIMAQYRNPGWTPADWFGRARLGWHGCHWAWRGFEVVLVKTEQFCFIQRENFPEKNNSLGRLPNKGGALLKQKGVFFWEVFPK